VENDVNAAAIGESIYGAGRGHQDFVCLTYGTGVGGAVFSGGRIFHGSSCSAGEFGAIVTHPEDRIPAEDMFTGCYEKYASVTALVRHAMQLDPSLSNGRIIFARRNEPDVCRLIDAWILEIVYGLTTIVHMLNPSCMILGGGVMEQDFLTDRIRAVLMEHIMPGYRHLTLCQAQLGNQAGLLGASVLHTL
jgi:predicted NBD/HSP70 family sugar kinase